MRKHNKTARSVPTTVLAMVRGGFVTAESTFVRPETMGTMAKILTPEQIAGNPA